MDYNILLPLGIFTTTASLLTLIYRTSQQNRFKAFGKVRVTLLERELLFKKERVKQGVSERKGQVLGRLAVAFLFAVGAGRNPVEILRYFILGYIVAWASSRLVVRIVSGAIKSQKMKDVAILFEAIELYMKGGYSLYQALMLSRSLVPNLKKEIDICLDYWSESPQKALEKFKEALAIEEGEILVSLLIHMEASGTRDLSGALGKEAFNVERLRRLNREMSIAMRPTYLMVYRFLPLASAIGIITGPLLYRTYVVLKDASVMGF